MNTFHRCGLFGVAIFLALSAHAASPTLQQDPAAARLYDFATRDAQFRALASLPAADVKYGKFGRLRQVKGATGMFVPAAGKLKVGDNADELFQKVKAMLMASAHESLVVRTTGKVPIGEGHFYSTNQVIERIPVVDARINFEVDQNGQITFINSLFVPKSTATSKPKISQQQARLKLEEHLAGLVDRGGLTLGAGGSLAFWTDAGTLDTPKLVWMIEASYTKDRGPRASQYGVDAATGEVLFSHGSASGLDRMVYSNNYLPNLVTPPSSRLLWTEGNPNPADGPAFNIYQRAAHPINAWAGRSPYAYDVLGLVAHWGAPDADGAWQIFGTDQKPYLFFSDSRSSDDDAIAHEYGHPLFFWSTNVEPPVARRHDEFFAGSEFWADFSAVVTDIHRFGMTSNSWQITDLRNWADPQSEGVFFNDWYPHRYFASPFSPEYSNSTIFGYAVYLMVNGGQHRRAGALALQGPIPSIQVPAAPFPFIREVLVTALYHIGISNEPFTALTFSDWTTNVAAAIHGSGSTVHTSVRNAWIAVGIRKDCTAPPATPDVVVQSQYCRGMHDITWNAMPNVKYHGQAVTAIYGWDTAYTVDVVDGTNTSCHQDILTYTRYRMRACNACGCSAWSPDEYMSYWRTCQ